MLAGFGPSSVVLSVWITVVLIWVGLDKGCICADNVIAGIARTGCGSGWVTGREFVRALS